MTSVSDFDPNDIPESERKRAEKLFAHARTVADTGNNDYAIELYLQGLSHNPEDAEAHKELRRISLVRKAAGGKPMGALKAMGLKKPSKDAKANLLNAEKLLAYEPGNVAHMVAVAKAAQKGGFRQTALWIGPLLLRANLDGKQDTNTFLLLKDLYRAVGEFKLAMDALGYAAASKPEDADLQHELRELAAQMTISQGNYGGGGDFRNSVRDADKQRQLMEEDADIRSVDAMQGQIARARKEWEDSGRDNAKLVRLVEALTKSEDLKNENEAIDLLEAAYKESKSYRYRFMSEEIKLRQHARMERAMAQQLEENPDDEDLKKTVAELAHDRLVTELKHFQGAIKAYPTDMRMKFEAGRRLFELGRYDEAIPMLQQAQADAKYRDDAVVMLGRAFLEAEFVDEAIDTLRNKIETYQVQGDAKSKEMYYWYGRALQENGDSEAAQKAYSQIAQWDFGYRDVQQRIRELRAAARS